MSFIFKMKRILLFRIGQLGDIIVALPSLWAIRSHLSDATVALLYDSHKNANYTKPLHVYPPAGLIDRYISYEANNKGASFFHFFKLFSKIRREGFETLVYLAPRFRHRGQVRRDLAFFRLAGIKNFIGHSGISPPPIVEPGKPLPLLNQEADYLLGRLALSGIPVPPPGQGCMDLGLTREEIEGARNWLDRQSGWSQERLLVGFGVGSKMPSKKWPSERFAIIGRYLIDQYNTFPIIFGGAEDKKLGDALVRQWRFGANAAGALNVRQAAATLKFCQLYIGNDTGTMHLAAAVGTKCIALFSARTYPGVWYPYGPQHIVLRRHVLCEGCMAYECKEHGNLCLNLISVEDVKDACHKAFLSI